jgi:hypothetical protein
VRKLHAQPAAAVETHLPRTAQLKVDRARIGRRREVEVVLELAARRVVHHVDPAIDVAVGHATIRRDLPVPP